MTRSRHRIQIGPEFAHVKQLCIPLISFGLGLGSTKEIFWDFEILRDETRLHDVPTQIQLVSNADAEPTMQTQTQAPRHPAFTRFGGVYCPFLHIYTFKYEGVVIF